MAEEKSELGNQNMICRSLSNVSKCDRIVYLNRKTNVVFFLSRLYYCYKSFIVGKGKTEEFCSSLNRHTIQKREKRTAIVFLAYSIFLPSPSY